MGISAGSAHFRYGIASLFQLFLLYSSFRFCVSIFLHPLEKQLAAGHFGVVFQAKAKTMSKSDNDPWTHGKTERKLAGKMVKARSDPTALESLVSELIILSYLGSHLNVVNLVGACTREILQGLFNQSFPISPHYNLSNIK